MASPYGQYPPNQKKPWYKRAAYMVPLTILGFFILILGGCVAIVGKAADDVSKDIDSTYAVTYQVEGDAVDAHVNYNVGETESASESGVTGGWSKDVEVQGLFGASLIVTNGYGGTGDVTCRIIANGKTVSETTGSGEFGGATCNAGFDELKAAFE